MPKRGAGGRSRLRSAFIFRETIRVALGSIKANALRSALTALGIVIGTSAVIAVVAMGEGAQRRIEAQIENLGTNILTVRPGQGFFRGVASGTQPLEESDALALRDRIGDRYEIAPEVSSTLQVTYSRWNSSNNVVGSWPSYFSVHSHELTDGRFFTESEEQGRRRVAVLGANVPEELGTPASLLVGEEIKIRNVIFEVVGVLKEKGGAMWMRPDDQVFIPLSTAIYRVMGGRDRLRSIYVAAPSPDDLDPAWGEIDQVIRREHRILPTEEADFSIQRSSDILETFNETTEVFTMLLAGIAGVSLLVGGIGIMNIMLVSVTERTREIGVRKALGATRATILLQFLIEALVLCVIGGTLGVLAGAGAASAITQVYGQETAISPMAVLVALGFSAVIGLFFGIWPARRASIMDPIDALRYE